MPRGHVDQHRAVVRQGQSESQRAGQGHHLHQHRDCECTRTMTLLDHRNETEAAKRAS